MEPINDLFSSPLPFSSPPSYKSHRVAILRLCSPSCYRSDDVSRALTARSPGINCSAINSTILRVARVPAIDLSGRHFANGGNRPAILVACSPFTCGQTRPRVNIEFEIHSRDEREGRKGAAVVSDGCIFVIKLRSESISSGRLALSL